MKIHEIQARDFRCLYSKRRIRHKQFIATLLKRTHSLDTLQMPSFPSI